MPGFIPFMLLSQPKEYLFPTISTVADLICFEVMVKMEEKDVFLGRMFYYLKPRLLDKKKPINLTFNKMEN